MGDEDQSSRVAPADVADGNKQAVKLCSVALLVVVF